MNARLMRVLEKTASKGKTFTTKHVTRREVPILVKTSPVEQPNYNIMAVHLHVLSDKAIERRLPRETKHIR